jgi:phosphoribosylglycinamide formyltransferase 1
VTNVFRLAVFASGKGSNLRAIDEAIRSGSLVGIELALVVSNNSTAEALEYARTHGIPALHCSVVSAGSEAAHESTLLQALTDQKIDLIALAGYLKRIPNGVVRAFEGRMINIHPALLPDFGGEGMYGIHVHRAVLAAHRSRTGATVHYVSGEYDTGTIIAQAECAVESSDTPESISKKVLHLEHELYPRALQIVVDRLRSESK